MLSQQAHCVQLKRGLKPQSNRSNISPNIYLIAYFDFFDVVSRWSNRPTNISQNLPSNILFEACDQKVPVQFLRRCGERKKT